MRKRCRVCNLADGTATAPKNDNSAGARTLGSSTISFSSCSTSSGITKIAANLRRLGATRARGWRREQNVPCPLAFSGLDKPHLYIGVAGIARLNEHHEQSCHLVDKVMICVVRYIIASQLAFRSSTGLEVDAPISSDLHRWILDHSPSSFTVLSSMIRQTSSRTRLDAITHDLHF